MKSIPPLPGARRRRTSIGSLLGALALALCAGSVPVGQMHAADVYEGFDYADGAAISGQSGGTGWSTPWHDTVHTGSLTADTTSLTYPGLVPAPAGRKLKSLRNAGNNQSIRTFRNLATPLGTGTHYISVLIQQTNTSDRYVGLALATPANVEKCLLGSTTGYPVWTINRVQSGEVFPPEHPTTPGQPTGVLSSSGVARSELSLLVLKLELVEPSAENPGGLDQVTFWVNPDLSLPESDNIPVGGQSFTTTIDYESIGRVRIGSASGTAGTVEPVEHLMDEIRISPYPPFAHGRIAVEQPAGTALENGVSSRNFGTRGVGKPHTLTYTLSNTGTDNLSGLAVAVGGTNPADFVAGALGATTLAPSESTTFDVTFTPSALGARASTLTISSDDLVNGSFVVAQTGQGAGATLVVEEPASTPLANGVTRDFGSSPVGTPASPLTFTLRNTGLADLTINEVAITGTHAADFVAGTPGAATLAPSESTTFDVTFTPSAPGARSASLSIASDAPGSPFTLVLAGTATKVVQTITFSPPGDRFITEVLALSATGGASGKVVVFTVVSGPAVVVDGELRFTGSGRVILAANQEGDDNHEAAPSVEHSFDVILPHPDVAVGAKPNALKGVRSYAPTKQLVDLSSSKARRVTGHIGVGNNAILPDGRAVDRITVQGKKGNALFKVKYNGPGGNVTAAVVAVGYQTAAIDGSSGMTKLQTVVTPNKKKLKKRKGQRTVYLKKTFSTLMRATSTAYRPASDSATIRVRTR